MESGESGKEIRRGGGIHISLGAIGNLGITFEWRWPPEQSVPLNVCKWTPNSYLKYLNFIPYVTSVLCRKP